MLLFLIRFGASSLWTTGVTILMSADAPLSGQSTFPKNLHGGRMLLGGVTCVENSDFTTVVFSFCDEQFPYCTKIPGWPVMLQQFMEYLPKKSSYRWVISTHSFTVCKACMFQFIIVWYLVPLWYDTSHCTPSWYISVLYHNGCLMYIQLWEPSNFILSNQPNCYRSSASIIYAVGMWFEPH